jgi:hypothetical protein
MTTPVTADNIRSLWQKMPTDTLAISADEMRLKARKFQSSVRVRNFIEYVAFVIVVLGFGSFVVSSTTWQGKATAILMILCAGVAVWNLHRRGKAIATPAGASANALIDFQRAELTRQRDLLLTTWRWYFLPFLPGIVAFMIVGWMGLLGNDVPLERVQRNIVGVGVGFVVIFAIGILLQLLGAAHLQRRIEDLDRYKEKP